MPSREPDKRFELYSVPSFEIGEPERLPGYQIGSSKQAVETGAVLLCRINPRINRVWVVGQTEEENPQIASTEWVSLGPVGEFAPRFLMYALQVPSVREYLTSNVSGVGGSLMRIRKAAIWRTRVPLAPLPEQHRIITSIEDLFGKLDEGVAALERAKTSLEHYRASVLKAAVEGRLTEQWRNANPPKESGEELLERILVERRKCWEDEQLAKFKAKGTRPPKNWKKKYKEPAHPDTRGLPELPDGWCWVGLEHLSAFVPHALKAGPFGSALKKSSYVENGYKVYGQEQVLRGDPRWGEYYIDGKRFSALKNCAVRPGDLLISLVGTIGRTLVLPENIEPGIINPRLIKVSLNRRVAVPEFVQAYLRSPGVREVLKRMSHGGTMDVLNMRTLKALPFPLPPLAEQELLVQLTSGSSLALDRMEVPVRQCATYAALIRQSILKCAFKGRLVAQDPEDEPASVLLGRIRAEREAGKKKKRRHPTKRNRTSRSKTP